MMIIKRKKIDRCSIEMANNRAIHSINLAKMLVDDPRKAERIKSQECSVCFYSTKVGGAAMASTNCAICSAETLFSSTAVDILCAGCASKNNLCKCCGADIDLKNRRKPRDYEVANNE